MKIILCIGLIAGLVLTSRVGITEERGLGVKTKLAVSTLLLKNECTQEEPGEAAYHWNPAKGRWVFVGYRCLQTRNQSL